ncbi:MAG: hypothetical protein K2I47_01925 [Odoribacter sp.]|nr:hypothetical protein [Odoribacter sp.]
MEESGTLQQGYPEFIPGNVAPRGDENGIRECFALYKKEREHLRLSDTPSLVINSSGKAVKVCCPEG